MEGTWEVWRERGRVCREHVRCGVTCEVWRGFTFEHFLGYFWILPLYILSDLFGEGVHLEMIFCTQ